MSSFLPKQRDKGTPRIPDIRRRKARYGNVQICYVDKARLPIYGDVTKGNETNTSTQGLLQLPRP
ncbi:hypothetical protein DPMN_011347 [Dreissena polymorpha]|uniref:Uncharacterized protein n=1 Tax=Dreissena polymorpha TaxID=45954 RepID=A0A9D4N3F9_DREPO|nr:hypothetical protein DPMN_011347 [Dreissena polymorpha]